MRVRVSPSAPRRAWLTPAVASRPVDGSGGAARALRLAAWLVVAVVGLLMITQAFGWPGTRLIATLQSLTPYVIVMLAPVAVVAEWRAEHRLAATASLVLIPLRCIASRIAIDVHFFEADQICLARASTRGRPPWKRELSERSTFRSPSRVCLKQFATAAIG